MTTTTDKELLELAAKAAGIKVLQQSNGFWTIEVFERGLEGWNPLLDDGDALRLAVKLNISVDVNGVDGVTTAEYGYFERAGLQESHGDAPYEATRRAIVRAAAMIGESL